MKMATLLTKREESNMGKNRWFGNSDFKTSNSFIQSSEPYHVEDFFKTVRRLQWLERHGHVQSIYINTTGTNLAFAFRYTSDSAYNRFAQKIVSASGGLGRGVWDPFRDNHTMQTYILQNS